MQLGVAMDLTSGQWKCHIELLGRYLIGRGPENPSSSHTIPSFQKVRTWKKLDRVWAVNSDHKWPLGCKPCEESRTVQMKYGLMLWSCYTRWWPPTLIGLSNGFGFCVCVCVCTLSCVWVFVTPWTVACQAPLSMEFRRQEYWCGLPFPTPGDLPGNWTRYCVSKQSLFWVSYAT